MATGDALPDQQRWQAYAESVVVRPDTGEVLSGAGAVDQLPTAAPLHVITAHNPAGQPQVAERNAAVDEQLRRRLVQTGLTHFRATGGSLDATWTEPGYAVVGLSRAAAAAIAIEFQQEAIFELTDRVSIVIATADLTERSRRPRHRSTERGAPEMQPDPSEPDRPQVEQSVFSRIPEELWLASNEHAFAVRDIRPVSPGHTLIVPRRQVADWWTADDAQRQAIWSLVDVVKAAIDQEFAPDGYNVGFNAGSAAGQTVFHLHVHVVPRYLGDVSDPAAGVRRIVDPDA
ncbi:MAG TPA: DUF3293 domain-containing protein [Actinomycetota bacterium]|nr:DUF3293 domain-containing protein [Actinomycetota bacterium]